MVDVGSFCIDRTEVTQKQYKDFLDDLDGTVPDQSQDCESNTKLDESTGCNTQASRPAVCVQWCDAKAFCEWAGKRLCGKIGGGPLELAKYGLPWESEWGYACTQGAKTKYPWGDAPDTVCATDGCAPAQCTGHVGSLPQCTGVTPPFDQIFDLIGNVDEWIDACNATSCLVAGGDREASLFECAVPSVEGMYKVKQDNRLGFRCCADHLEGQ